MIKASNATFPLRRLVSPSEILYASFVSDSILMGMSDTRENHADNKWGNLWTTLSATIQMALPWRATLGTAF